MKDNLFSMKDVVDTIDILEEMKRLEKMSEGEVVGIEGMIEVLKQYIDMFKNNNEIPLELNNENKIIFNFVKAYSK